MKKSSTRSICIYLEIIGLFALFGGSIGTVWGICISLLLSPNKAH